MEQLDEYVIQDCNNNLTKDDHVMVNGILENPTIVDGI